MFTLAKWYLDVVSESGDAFIGYAARVRTGPISVDYGATLLAPAQGPAREASVVRRVDFPRLDGGILDWDCRSLDVRGQWVRESPPIQRTLARWSTGAIRWSCLLPRSRATVRCGGQVLTGWGYAERLCLTVTPWSLPFHSLRWGRHVSDRHGAVWIDWDGADRRCWAWIDGAPITIDRFDDTGAPRLELGSSLELTNTRTLRDRSVLGSLADTLPGPMLRLAGPLGRMREHKRLARSSLHCDDGPIDRGWTIYEEVTW